MTTFDQPGQSRHDPFIETAPGTLNGQFLRRFWFPVQRSDQLKPGQAKPLRALSENFTLYRGQEGTVHVVDQRCPHRGTQLSVGFVENDCVRCLYHGWKFDGSGQCVEQPAESAEFAAKIRIRGFPAREHLGLIWAYFGTGDPPAFPPIPAFEGDGILENTENLLPCNYFQGWENDWDNYHIVWTHLVGAVHDDFRPASEAYEETEYGVERIARMVNGATFTQAYIFPTTIRAVVPSPSWLRYRNAGPAHREIYIMHLPVDDETQIMFQAQHVKVPIAEREHYQTQYREFRQRLEATPAHEIAAEILAGRKTLAEVKAEDEHPFMAWVEDQCAQPGQGRIANRAAEHLGRSDRGIILLRKLWMRELRALSETGTTKAWSVMDRTLEDIARTAAAPV
jgi:5,5'-dehydrodivanillate O-demethylase